MGRRVLRPHTAERPGAQVRKRATSSLRCGMRRTAEPGAAGDVWDPGACVSAYPVATHLSARSFGNIGEAVVAIIWRTAEDFEALVRHYPDQVDAARQLAQSDIEAGRLRFIMN